LKCYNLSIQRVILFNYILNENILQENRKALACIIHIAV